MLTSGCATSIAVLYSTTNKQEAEVNLTLLSQTCCQAEIYANLPSLVCYQASCKVSDASVDISLAVVRSSSDRTYRHSTITRKLEIEGFWDDQHTFI